MPCSVCEDQDAILHKCNYCGKVVCDKHRIPEKHDCNILKRWLDKDYWFDNKLNQHHYRGSRPGMGVGGEESKKRKRSKDTAKTSKSGSKKAGKGVIPNDAPDVVWKCTQCEIVFDSNPTNCPRCSESAFYRKPIEGLRDPSSYRSYEEFVGVGDKREEGSRLLFGFTKVDIIVLVFLGLLGVFLAFILYRNFYIPIIEGCLAWVSRIDATG